MVSFKGTRFILQTRHSLPIAPRLSSFPQTESVAWSRVAGLELLRGLPLPEPASSSRADSNQLPGPPVERLEEVGTIFVSVVPTFLCTLCVGTHFFSVGTLPTKKGVRGRAPIAGPRGKLNWVLKILPGGQTGI